MATGKSSSSVTTDEIRMTSNMDCVEVVPLYGPSPDRLCV